MTQDQHLGRASDQYDLALSRSRGGDLGGAYDALQAAGEAAIDVLARQHGVLSRRDGLNAHEARALAATELQGLGEVPRDLGPLFRKLDRARVDAKYKAGSQLGDDGTLQEGLRQIEKLIDLAVDGAQSKDELNELVADERAALQAAQATASHERRVEHAHQEDQGERAVLALARTAALIRDFRAIARDSEVPTERIPRTPIRGWSIVQPSRFTQVWMTTGGNLLHEHHHQGAKRLRLTSVSKLSPWPPDAGGAWLDEAVAQTLSGKLAHAELAWGPPDERAVPQLERFSVTSLKEEKRQQWALRRSTPLILKVSALLYVLALLWIFVGAFGPSTSTLMGGLVLFVVTYVGRRLVRRESLTRLAMLEENVGAHERALDVTRVHGVD